MARMGGITKSGTDDEPCGGGSAPKCGPSDGPDRSVPKCGPDAIAGGGGGGISYSGGPSDGPDGSILKCGLNEETDGGGGVSYRGGPSDGPDGSVPKGGESEETSSSKITSFLASIGQEGKPKTTATTRATHKNFRPVIITMFVCASVDLILAGSPL